ncbi:MAG: hypothetical protein ACXWCY_32530 [Burkholderiales bacterium]
MNPKIERVELLGIAMTLVGECLKTPSIVLPPELGFGVILDD